MMKRILSMFAAVFLLTSVAIAAGPKDYQVTGPVLDVNDDVITVKKAKINGRSAAIKTPKSTVTSRKGQRSRFSTR